MHLLIIIFLLWCRFSLGYQQAVATDPESFELSATFEQEETVTSVLMQSVILPCKAILLVMEPERVKFFCSSSNDLIY